MEISTPVQLESSAALPAGGLIRLPRGQSPAGEPGARRRRFYIDTSRVTFLRDAARVRHTLVPRGRAVVAGLALGVCAHVIYLLIVCILPASGSGAAVLGERFKDVW